MFGDKARGLGLGLVKLKHVMHLRKIEEIFHIGRSCSTLQLKIGFLAMFKNDIFQKRILFKPQGILIYNSMHSVTLQNTISRKHKKALTSHPSFYPNLWLPFILKSNPFLEKKILQAHSAK